MLKQISFATIIATSTFTVLTKSKNPVLSDTFRESTNNLLNERLTSTKLNQRPGVLAWGLNKNNILSSLNDPVVRYPTHLDFFNGKVLRDLALADGIAVAVLENGDVVQWGDQSSISSPKSLLKGKNVIKVKVSDKSVYALTKSGLIYNWHTQDGDHSAASSITSSTTPSYFSFGWLWGSSSSSPNIKPLESPTLSFREYINDIEVGKDHILALTNNGRVFSGSTGSQVPSESKGQYGITTMSQYDSPPQPGKLHEIKLLKNIPIKQIATGDYHSLVLTKDGRLLGFGDNTFGQLGISYSYRTAQIAVPTELPISNALFPGDIQRKVTSISAGGSMTYFTVNAGVESEDLYSMGNGVFGQLGTGSFSNSQRTPLKIKHFSGLSEYSDSLNKTIPINIHSLSIGSNHTAVTLSSTSFQHDVLIWGSNEFSQLGNGKRNIAGYPKSIPLYELDPNTNSYTLSPTHVQLSKNITMEFKDDKSKSRKLKVDQVITCGANTTAIYYRPSK